MFRITMGNMNQDANSEAWARLGRLLIARRVELGFPKREAFAKAKGFKNTRVLAAIENAERTNFSPATIAEVEQAYEWAPFAVQGVLQGLDPVLRAPVAEPPETPSNAPEGWKPSVVLGQGFVGLRAARNKLVHGQTLTEDEVQTLSNYLEDKEIESALASFFDLPRESQLEISRLIHQRLQELGVAADQFRLPPEAEGRAVVSHGFGSGKSAVATYLSEPDDNLSEAALHTTPGVDQEPGETEE